VEQLAARTASQRLRIPMPVTSMIWAVVASAMSADVTNPRHRLCAPMESISPGAVPTSRKSRLTTSATSRASIRVSRSSAWGENATIAAPSSARGLPATPRSPRPRTVRAPAAAPLLLPCPVLIGLALADRHDEETRPAEVEILDVQAGDLRPPPPRGSVFTSSPAAAARAATISASARCDSVSPSLSGRSSRRNTHPWPIAVAASQWRSTPTGQLPSSPAKRHRHGRTGALTKMTA
jgi:hypothetical protein